MNLQPKVVRVVLDHGLPITIEVVAESMTPSLGLGDKLSVEAAVGELRAGDIVLIITDGDKDLLIHRVMHVFAEGGRRYVMHQGDAPASTFATCPREAVIGRATRFARDPDRPFPTVERLGKTERARFRRRRRACAMFSLGRRLTVALRLGDRKLMRRLAHAFRALVRSGEVDGTGRRSRLRLGRRAKPPDE